MNETCELGPSVNLKEQVCVEIKPRVGVIGIDWEELWRYRDLLFFLIWRDILVRYKQTLLGAAWALIQPLATMALFAVIFGQLAGIPSDGLPYPLFAYGGLLVWSFFSNSMNQAAASLISDEKLITKIYFPRIIIPVAPVIGCLLDLAIALTLLPFLMVFYGISPSLNVWVLPLVLVLTVFAALGAGIWLAAMNVKYRDFRYVIPFVTQFWMFGSPVVYPESMVPDNWRLLYA